MQEYDKITLSEDKVVLEWLRPVAMGTNISEKLESTERPAPAMIQAMTAFKAYVCNLLGLPAALQERMEIRTVHLKEDEKTDLRTLQVTVILTGLQCGNRTTTFTTPLMRERGEAEGGYYLEDETVNLIADLEEAAEAFYKGERMQPDLFPKSADDATTPPVEPDAQYTITGTSSEQPRRRARKKKPEAETGGVPEWNPPGEPYTDAKVRDLLARVDRDVPVDAIATWTAGERDQAVRWGVAETHRLVTRTPHEIAEPECVVKSATLPLKADGWTAPEPPPKVTDNGAQKVKAAIEAGAK